MRRSPCQTQAPFTSTARIALPHHFPISKKLALLFDYNAKARDLPLCTQNVAILLARFSSTDHSCTRDDLSLYTPPTHS